VCSPGEGSGDESDLPKAYERRQDVHFLFAPPTCPPCCVAGKKVDRKKKEAEIETRVIDPPLACRNFGAEGKM